VVWILKVRKKANITIVQLDNWINRLGKVLCGDCNVIERSDPGSVRRFLTYRKPYNSHPSSEFRYLIDSASKCLRCSSIKNQAVMLSLNKFRLALTHEQKGISFEFIMSWDAYYVQPTIECCVILLCPPWACFQYGLNSRNMDKDSYESFTTCPISDGMS
jgi:hypothetical protein